MKLIRNIKIQDWIQLILMAVLVIFTAANGFTQETQNKNFIGGYVKKQLLFLPWGKGDGQVGLKEEVVDLSGSARGGGIETLRYGPSQIEIDKDDNIFIFDDYNDRVIQYNKEGILLSNISFNFKKEKKEHFPINKFKGEFQYSFSTDEKDDIVIEIKDNYKLIKKFKKDAYTGLPIDIDIHGNVFNLHDTTLIGSSIPDTEDWMLKISKYSKDGQLLAKFRLAEDIDYTYRRKGQRGKIIIDKQGNIYQLLLKKEGAYLLKWEAPNEKK